MEKIKQLLAKEGLTNKTKDILTVVILILVSFGSFGLGRLSLKGDEAGLKIEYPDRIEGLPESASATQTNSRNLANAISSPTLQTNNTPETKKNFFASKIGRKYYGINCSAGKSIKIENRIYFETREEAEKAGYELSSSCR